MELMPGYKRSDVGVIPDDWDCLRACEFGFFKGGSGFPLWAQGQRTGEYPFFKVSDMNNEGNETFMTAANHYVSEQTRKHLGAQVFPADSIVFAKVGAAVFLERKKILGQPSCIDNNMAAYVLDASRADVRFVHSMLLMKKLGALVATTALPALNGKQLGEMVLALPPLPEQRVIAAALSDVDALLATLDQMIAKKRDLKQATMQQLLTGKTRLPGFSGDWEDVTMRQVLIQNATYGIVTAGNFVQNGVKMLRGGDIADGRINTDLPMVTHEKAAEYGRTALVKDDVVIALVGYPGASAKIPDELFGANISRAVGLLRLNHKVSADFLVCFLNSPDGRRMVLAPSAGSAQQVVNLAALNKLQFSVPPPPEQVAIAKVLTQMDDELAVLESRRDKTRNIKQAMMQELLTGKTRLV